MITCPKCACKRVVKNGTIWGKPRWKCKNCNCQFTRTTARGRPVWQKSLAVFLYCNGMSMNALANMFGVQASSVLKWIRNYAVKHYEKPEPEGSAIIMELDEMWHYIKKNGTNSGYGKLLIAIMANCLTGNVGIVTKPH